MLSIKKVFVLFLSLGLSVMASAQVSLNTPAKDLPVQSYLRVPEAVAAGDTVWVAVGLEHAPTWHTYYLEPGESGVPTTVSWELPEGWSATEELRWPEYETIDTAGIISFGYSGTVELLAQLSVPADFKPGDVAKISANVDFLMCDPNQCVPGAQSVSATLLGGEQTLPLELMAGWTDAPEGNPLELMESQKSGQVPAEPVAVATLSWGILGGAFLGGLILNLMPCVFPILGIKILSFVKAGGQDKARVVLSGAAYALGIVVSLLAIGLVIAVLKGAGEQLGWGFQLQNPFIVWALLIIVVAVAMNLLGVFELPAVGSSLVGHATGNTFVGNFLSGVLMVGLATPCSAPFLAGALGSIFVLPLGLSLVVLAVMGLGLAAPYLLLSAFPSAAKALPKPGEWMVLLKKILAFPMLAAAAYLVWVYVGQVDDSGTLLRSMLWLVGFAFGLWLLGQGSREKIGLALVGATFFVLGMFSGAPFGLDVKEELTWEKWSPQRVEELRADNRYIYVDFTARWCATCQVNKAVVFDNPNIINLVKVKNVVLLKADWTRKDPAITQELAAYGRAAVPFTLIYHPDFAEPFELSEVLSADSVIETLEKESDIFKRAN